MKAGQIYRWNESDVYVMFLTPTLGILVKKTNFSMYDKNHVVGKLVQWETVENNYWMLIT